MLVKSKTQRDIVALPLAIPVLYEPQGKCDRYNNDMWMMVLHKNKYAASANVALNVAIQTIF